MNWQWWTIHCLSYIYSKVTSTETLFPRQKYFLYVLMLIGRWWWLIKKILCQNLLILIRFGEHWEAGGYLCPLHRHWPHHRGPRREAAIRWIDLVTRQLPGELTTLLGCYGRWVNNVHAMRPISGELTVLWGCYQVSWPCYSMRMLSGKLIALWHC